MLHFEEIREAANVNTRAQRLFQDGYRLQPAPLGADFRFLLSPQGNRYLLDIRYRCCHCAYFLKHGGTRSCKHLLGWRKLEADQQAEERAQEDAWCNEADRYVAEEADYEGWFASNGGGVFW